MAGFLNTGRDTADPPPPQDNDAGDHGELIPEFEDDGLDTRPDKDAMDAAIADFLRRLKAQEKELYAGLHGALSHRPVSGKVDLKGLSVHAAMEAGMLQRMDDEDTLRFTPAEVLLYWHAQDHWYVWLCTV